MTRLSLLFASILSVAMASQPALPAPSVLPHTATLSLTKSLEAAARHTRHVWRDTPPLNEDGTINAYVEIPLGDRRKWEFDMAANARAIDRMIPEGVGGYPINYGFVPQTVSHDGDPFDVLVLGPALPGGQVVRGIPVGLMLMEDEKGTDAKVVVSTVDERGRARHQLTDATRDKVGDYFRRYKLHEPGAFSRVPGWRPAADGVALVRLTHTFFRECRRAPGPCAVDSDPGTLTGGPPSAR